MHCSDAAMSDLYDCSFCRPLPKTTLGTPGIPGLKTRSWKEQSGTITDNLKETKSRSPSTIAQVRLQEALHQCSLASGCSAAGDGKPHRIRTAVCCKLLEELSALAGPYANMLQILCKEMVCSCTSGTPCAILGDTDIA